MTVRAQRQRASAPRQRTAGTAVVPEELPIGQEEQQIFSCPVCARPLARGAGRCPGCHTRLVNGVPLSKASLFMVTGLVVGILFGGGTVAGYTAISGTLRAPATNAAATGPVPSAPPATGGGASGGGAASAAPGPGGSGSEGTTAIPAMASSSLRQSAVLNQKLLADRTALRAAVAASRLDTQATATLLRSIANSAQFGAEIAPRIAGWHEAASLSSDLSGFYALLRETARTGLAASLNNTQAYKQAATDMIGALGAVEALQTRLSELAATGNIVLPTPTP
jgi:hypothetical protein